MAPEAAVAASRSVEGASRGPRSSSCRVLKRCSSLAWPQKQQLQRPGALLERCVAPEAQVAASGNVAGASLGSRSALQERCVDPEAAVAASGSLAGASRGSRSSCSVVGEWIRFG